LKTEQSVRALSSCVLFQLLARTKFSPASIPIVDDEISDALIISSSPDSIRNVISSESQAIFLSINPNTLNNGYEN